MVTPHSFEFYWVMSPFVLRFVALPLSRWMGVRDQTRRQMKPNPVLEKYFLRMGQRPLEVSPYILLTSAWGSPWDLEIEVLCSTIRGCTGTLNSLVSAPFLHST